MALSVRRAAAVVALGATVSREFLPELDEVAICLPRIPAEFPCQGDGMDADLRTVVMEFPEVSKW